MQIAAHLVIAVVANIGDSPNYYQPQNWDGPTRDDLVTCADLARQLNETYDALARKGLNEWTAKYATCEISIAPEAFAPKDDARPRPTKVSYQF